MLVPVGRLQLVPPVIADTILGMACEFASAVALGRIDQADWHTIPRKADREGKVAVVGDHDRCTHSSSEHVNEQVGRNVNVRALLLSAGDRGHESGVGNILFGSILNHQRTLGVADDRLAVSASRGEWCRGDPGDVVAVADLSGRAGALERPKVNILLLLADGIAGPAYARSAVGHCLDDRMLPAGVFSEYTGRESPQIEPAPPRRLTTANSTTSVVEVVAIDVDADLHEVSVCHTTDVLSRASLVRSTRGTTTGTSRGQWVPDRSQGHHHPS